LCFQTVEPARSIAHDRAMAVNLWSDESKTFEDVNDGPLTADEIAEVRVLWRRATTCEGTVQGVAQHLSS
jgi:hypothetical protein